MALPRLTIGSNPCFDEVTQLRTQYTVHLTAFANQSPSTTQLSFFSVRIVPPPALSPFLSYCPNLLLFTGTLSRGSDHTVNFPRSGIKSRQVASFVPAMAAEVHSVMSEDCIPKRDLIALGECYGNRAWLFLNTTKDNTLLECVPGKLTDQVQCLQIGSLQT